MIFLPILFFLSLFFNSTTSFFFFFFLELLIFKVVFGFDLPLLCTGAFSGCREQGLPSPCGARVSHRGGFSRCGAQAPGARVSHRGGFSRCGAQAQVRSLLWLQHGLSCCASQSLELGFGSCGA